MALRTPLSVTPHLYMGDSTGRPLDKGVVYFGEQDKDPEFYPINLFSDDALTKPLAQPVHTKGGYLYDKGDMVEPHAKELIYSVKVLDSYGRKVFYKGAMMRNSWNDDVIEQINTAIIDSADAARQVAIDITNNAIDTTVIENSPVSDALVSVDGSLSQRTINKGLESIADLSTINNPKDGLRVYVKSYHSGLGKGGGYFTYNSSKANINDGGLIIRGWVRDSVSPVSIHMFGAIGDNSLHKINELVTSGLYQDLDAVKAVYPHVSSLDDSLCWAATQAAVNICPHVYMPEGAYLFNTNTLTVHHGLRILEGVGTRSRILSSAEVAIKWNGSIRCVNTRLAEFYVLGDDSSTTSIGIDFSGFSYGVVSGVRVRNFGKAGMYANGDAQNGKVAQFSNMQFENCTSNNNKGDGFLMEGSSGSNSANTFIACEFAGNGRIGFNEVQGYVNQAIGCTFQGNVRHDLYSNGNHSIYEFYSEPNATTGDPNWRPVYLDVDSYGVEVSCRSSYPMWQTFEDYGSLNKISIRQESQTDRHYFHNPTFNEFNMYGTPLGIKHLAATVTYDTSSVSTHPILDLTFADTGHQGLDISLEPAKELKNQWVTLILDMDLSNYSSESSIDVRSFTDGDSPSTVNLNQGEYANKKFKKMPTKNNIYFFDVRFKDLDIVNPVLSLRFSDSWGGEKPTGNIKIKRIYAIKGRGRSCSNYTGDSSYYTPAGFAGSHLSNRSHVINSSGKYTGKIAFVPSGDKFYMATGSSPDSKWLQIGGSEVISPV